MKKEKWIEEIIAGAKEIKPVASNPYMASKVEAILQNEKATERISPRWLYTAAAAMVFVIMINVFAWRNASQTPPDHGLQQLVQEYGWNHHEFYSVNYSK